MGSQDTPEVLAEMRATPARRLTGAISLILLALMLIIAVLNRPIGSPWQMVLILTGIGAIWATLRMYRATASAVQLTPEGLRDADGTRIVDLVDIAHVDRGFLAFKPSNGLILRARSGGVAHWRPGLWWRAGKRIGIGGMTPAHQAKAMSEQLGILMKAAENRNDPRG